jgi:hypothetical protein
MNLKMAVDRAKPQNAQRKPNTYNGHVIHHFGEPDSKPNFLFSLCDLCGEMLF